MTATHDVPDHGTRPSDRGLSEGLHSLERRRPFRSGLVIGIALSLAVALLVVQNGHSTNVSWLWLDFETPLWLLLVVTLAAGVVIGEAAKLAWHRARARESDRHNTLSAARRRLGRT